MNENKPLSKKDTYRQLLQAAFTDYQLILENQATLPDVIFTDALFYSFEHIFFLLLKTLKAALKEHGLKPVTPKQHLEMALAAGFILPEERDDWWVLLMASLDLAEIYEPEETTRFKEAILTRSDAIEKIIARL